MRLFHVFILGLIMGCSPEPFTIVLDWSVNTNHTGLYVALEKGYFEAEGLKVKVQNAPVNGVPAVLTSGHAQIGFSYQEEVLQSQSKDLKIQAIAAVIDENTSGFAAPRTKGIKRPRDFEGKKYGGWGSDMEKALLNALVKADGGDPSKVEILNTGDLDYFASTEKVVDFSWIFYGWTGVEAETRGVPLDFIPLKNILNELNFYTPVMAVHETWAQKNSFTVKKFLKALSKGYEFSIQNPGEAAAILLKQNPDLNPTLVRKSQEYLSREYKGKKDIWGEIDPKRWIDFYNWMVRSGILTPIKNPQNTFTNNYLIGSNP